MRYSIWITPPGSVAGQIRKIIAKLAGKYDGIIFPPHVTIVGNVDQDLEIIKKKIEKIAKRTENLGLSSSQVSFGNTYFHNVFVNIKPTPQLMQLNLDIKRVLGLENRAYFPHISLLYGNQDLKTREKIASEVKIKSFSFIARGLVIIPETPEPSGWKPVTVIPFE